VPIETLRGQFGDNALKIYLATEGKYYERVQASYPPNLLHESFLFEGSIDDALMLDCTLEKMSSRLAKRLAGRQASDIELKIDVEDEEPQTSLRRFTRPCHDAATILAALRALRSGQPMNKLVIGVHVTLSGIQFARTDQLSLSVSRSNLNSDRTIRSLQNVFGEGTVKQASQLEISRRKRVLKEWSDATGWH
jgi:hypothetical protein